MRRSVVSLTILSLILGLGAVVLCVACDSEQEKADRSVQAELDQADRDHTAAAADDQADPTSDHLATVQSKYDTLAREQGISPQMEIVVHARAGQVRMERAARKIAALRSKELQIIATINNIEQMGIQVAGAQASIASLTKRDPAEQIQAAKAQEDKLKSGQPSEADQATLAQVEDKIQSVTAEIDKVNTDSQSAHDAGAKARDQAETLTRQAEGEQTNQMTDTLKASDLRKTAAIDDSQVDGFTAKTVLLQFELDGAKAQKAALEASVATCESEITAMQNGWAAIQKQIDAQKQIQQSIIGSASGSGDDTTITNSTKTLAGLLTDADAARKDLKDLLDGAIQQLGAAESNAKTLRGTLMTKTQGTDPSALINKQLMMTTHPAAYTLQKAEALEIRAGVAANEAVIAVMVNQMLNGYQVSVTAAGDALKAGASDNGQIKIAGLTTLLSRDTTGIDPPSSLADIINAFKDVPLADMKTAVDTDFQDTVDAYTSQSSGGTDSGDVAKARGRTALIGQSVTHRQWADYAAMIGDAGSAQKHAGEADADQSQLSAMDSGNPMPDAAPQEAPTPDNTQANPATTSPTDAGATGTTDTTGAATMPAAAPADNTSPAQMPPQSPR